MPVPLLLFRPLPLADGNAGVSDSLVVTEWLQTYCFSGGMNLRRGPNCGHGLNGRHCFRRGGEGGVCYCRKCENSENTQ